MAWKIFKRNKKRDVVKDITAGVDEAERKGVFGSLRFYLSRLVPYAPIFLVILILSFWYVDNRYVCEMQMRKVAELEKELQDRKYTYLTTRSDLTRLSRQSVVAKAVEERGLGLKVTTEPVIKVNK